MIDHFRNNRDNDFEVQLDDEIRVFETTGEADDRKPLEYHYELLETVRSFKDYLCIVFLNLAHILTYSHETFYESVRRIKLESKMVMF